MIGEPVFHVLCLQSGSAHCYSTQLNMFIVTMFPHFQVVYICLLWWMRSNVVLVGGTIDGQPLERACGAYIHLRRAPSHPTS